MRMPKTTFERNCNIAWSEMENKTPIQAKDIFLVLEILRWLMTRSETHTCKRFLKWQFQGVINLELNKTELCC